MRFVHYVVVSVWNKTDMYWFFYRLKINEIHFLFIAILKSTSLCGPVGRTPLYIRQFRLCPSPRRHTAATARAVVRVPSSDSKSNRNHRCGNGARFTGETVVQGGQKRWMTVISSGRWRAFVLIYQVLRRRNDKVRVI